MDLQILGTRGEIEESAPWHTRHSGVLVDRCLLLDLGEREYLHLAPDTVVITHLHPDHAFFVREEVSIDLPVYAPGEYHDGVDVHLLPEELTLSHHTVRSFPTHHSKRVRSVALVVEDALTRFCYTGDLIWINREYHSHLENLDLVITDGSYLRQGGLVRRDPETGVLFGHTGIPDLIRLFSRFTTHIRFVHFGTWFFHDIEGARRRIREIGEEYGVDARATRDGEEIRIDDLA